jgi:hypothetical protein
MRGHIYRGFGQAATFINDDRSACEKIAFARLKNECLDAAD